MVMLVLLKEEKVKLYGPNETGPEVLQTYRDLRPKFQTLGLAISSLVLNERRAWQIILDNGIRLELGKESLDERIERFFCFITSSAVTLKESVISILGTIREPQLVGSLNMS